MAYSDRELLGAAHRVRGGRRGGERHEGGGERRDEPRDRLGRRIRRVGQGSIRKIIMQPGQFVCASETERGAYNPQNIYNMRPTDVHYSIADWAMAGNRLTGLGDALWFFNPFSDTCRPNFPSQVGVFRVRIGDHCFYDPTEAYYDT